MAGAEVESARRRSVWCTHPVAYCRQRQVAEGIAGCAQATAWGACAPCHPKAHSTHLQHVFDALLHSRSTRFPRAANSRGM